VEQTLENKPTAGLGRNHFGDIVFARTAVTFVSKSYRIVYQQKVMVLFER
jgi:hypothetical protein